MLNSYPSIYALGHRAIADILKGTFVVEEKVDGSQFSMGRGLDGTLACRSKGKELIVDAPEKMFAKAVETAASLDLKPGWVYRGEYLQSPKHNTLAYRRVPEKHVIIFDVCTGPETYLTPNEKLTECERLGVECVPCFFEGTLETFPADVVGLENFLLRESILGGKVEGVVVKNYGVFTAEGKIAIAKKVSAEFQEKHRHEWKKSNPTQSDVVQFLTTQLATEARWNKAIQHLRDAGQLTESPKDIGPLIKEIQADTAREEAYEVKETLFKHFWPHISRGIIHGFPEYYKKLTSVDLPL